MDSNPSDTHDASSVNTGATNFVDDENHLFNNNFRQAHLMDNYIPEPCNTNSITDFLQRPVKILDVEWSANAVTNTILGSFEIDPLLLSFPLWTQKLDGYRFIRATANFRIVMNAQPYQMGRLMLNYLPFDSVNPSRSAAWRTNLGSRSMLPGIEMDCRDTSASLCIPYVTPYTHFDRYNQSETSRGAVDLTVLTPLTTTDASTVDVSIWLHWSEIQVYGPVITQSLSESNKPYIFNNKLNNKHNRIYTKVETQSSAHSNHEKGKASVMLDGEPIIELHEKTRVQRGLVQQVATDVKNLATMSSEVVPALSWISEPVSWLASGVSVVASWFGWSKPTTEEGMKYYAERGYRYLGMATGANYGEALSLIPDPRVQVLPGFAGSDDDELSFNYLRRIPCYVDSVEWTTATADNSVITAFSINPTDIAHQFLNSGLIYNTRPGLMGLTPMFTKWSGSINVHIKIVKTDYHSGRLSLNFQPESGGTSLTTEASATQLPYALREVVDIRETTDYTLTLPFISNKKYLDIDQSSGVFSLTVANELRASSIAPNKVDILVYFSCGDNFEFACPVGTTLGSNVVPQNNSTGKKTYMFNGQKIDMHAGGNTIAEVRHKALGVIGNGPSSNKTLSNMALCIGEAFTSVKQILNRANHIGGSFGDNHCLYPWTFYMRTDNLANPFWGDLHSYIAQGYALFRGGVNISFIPERERDVAANDRFGRFAYISYANSIDAISLDVVRPETDPITPVDTNATGGSVAYLSKECRTVTIPYSSSTPCSIVSFVDNDNILNYHESAPQVGICSYVNDATISRSFPDDFQFGMFTGFLPTVV